MTAADLSGRDLDAAVARVIWRDGDIEHAAHPAHGRRYSTDPATLDEMDEWLLQHCGCVDSLRCRLGCTAVARREDPHLVGLRVWQVAYGSTRNDAHARLVVAVKEAMS